MTLETSSWAPRPHFSTPQAAPHPHRSLRSTKSSTFSTFHTTNRSPTRAPLSARTSNTANRPLNNLHTPPTTPPLHAPSSLPPPRSKDHAPTSQDLNRITRLLRRLHWKATSLTCSYSRAAAAAHPDHSHNHPSTHDELSLLPSTPSTPALAEQMFKVDFHEFYVLLERILVLLLEAVGNHLPSSALMARDRGRGLASSKHARTFSPTRPPHRYHETILQTLSSPTCPLYTTLGHGEARRYLALAKELRNRWKDADASSFNFTTENASTTRDQDREGRLLKEFDLPALLRTLLWALEQARGVVAAEVGEGGMVGGSTGDGGLEGGFTREGWIEGGFTGDGGLESGYARDGRGGEVPYEAVGDPMEWDAE